MAADPSPYSDHRVPPPQQPPPETPFSGGIEDNEANKPAQVWNKPSTAAAAAGHVIAGEDSWPALSGSTRNGSKSGVDPRPLSTSQGHLILNPKKNKDQIRNQNHSNANQNHKPNANQASMPARQRSKRGRGSGSGPSQNGISNHPRLLPLARPPPLPPALAIPSPPPLPPYPIYEGSFGPLPPPMPFFIPPPFNGNNWERRPVAGFALQPRLVNDQSVQRNYNLRGSYAGPPRGDGAGNSGHVSRRDHQRDRNASHKGFVGPSQSQVPQPPPPPFFPMPSMRPFPDPIGFDMASPYVNFPAPPPEFFMHFPPPLPLFAPPMDPALPSQLIRQIDHYFSDDNLAKDLYLRGGMDNEGWVDIAFIAEFPMVKRMTQNLQLILDSLKDSTVLEVQGNRIRRRNDWRKWLLSVPRSSTISSSPTQADSAENTLINSIKNVKLEDETNSINVTYDGEAVSSSNVVHLDVANQ